MKSVIRWTALVLALGAACWWLLAGANRGWTKTSLPKKVVDDVTGIEATVYESRFVPGIDFLGAALLGAGALAGISVLLKSKTTHSMQKLKSTLPALLTLALVTSTALATPQTFDFKDPKGVNTITFKLDAPLESIEGNANGITGTVQFDPEKPAATTGKIVVATKSLHVPQPMMKTHLHGEQWMNVSKHPEITFEAKQLQNVKTTGDVTTADLQGTLTMLGISKELSVPVKLTYLKGKLSQRVPNQNGDLLVIRSNFTVRRADFGINPKAPADKVSDTIDLALSIAGSSPK